MVVYYAKFGDLIKIGTTGDLRARMSALRPDALLATEPGDEFVEKVRHRQFNRDRVRPRAELFRSSDELLHHIDLINGPPESRPPSPTVDAHHEDAMTRLMVAKTAADASTARVIAAQANIEAIVRLVHAESDFTHGEIADVLGVHRNTVINWCKRAGAK